MSHHAVQENRKEENGTAALGVQFKADSSFFTYFVDLFTGNAYNENGKRVSSLWCGWHLKSEIDAGLWAGMLGATEKPDSDAVEWSWIRGNCMSADDRKTSYEEKICGIAVLQSSLFLLF